MSRPEAFNNRGIALKELKRLNEARLRAPIRCKLSNAQAAFLGFVDISSRPLRADPSEEIQCLLESRRKALLAERPGRGSARARTKCGYSPARPRPRPYLHRSSIITSVGALRCPQLSAPSERPSRSPPSLTSALSLLASKLSPGSSPMKTDGSRSGLRQCAWMAATLDGIVEGTEAVFEAKFVVRLAVADVIIATAPARARIAKSIRPCDDSTLRRARPDEIFVLIVPDKFASAMR